MIQLAQERDDYRLSLRKKKIEDKIMQKRLNTPVPSESTKNYCIDPQTLKIKDEYKSKQFNTLEELVLFVANLLSSQNLDDILFGIFLLKKSNNLHNLPNEELLVQTNLIDYFYDLLNQYSDNKILVNEIIWVSVNISFNSNEKIIELFTTIKFLHCYSMLLKKYGNDEIITISLISLFGNLVCSNLKVQKLFYESNFFNVMFSVASSKIYNQIKENSFWFITCFVQNIPRNYFFKDKVDVLIKCQELFFENIVFEQYTTYCLSGLGALAETEDQKAISNFLNNSNFFSFIFSLPNKYYCLINKIIINLTSNNEEVNLMLIKKYNCLNFVLAGLESQSIKLNIEALNTLNNIVNDNNQEIFQILIDKKIMVKIIELSKSFTPVLVSNSIGILNDIIIRSDCVIAETLSSIGIVDVLMDIIAKNFDDNIIDKALDGIYYLLTKDKIIRNNEKKFYTQMEHKGGKELFEKIILKSNNKTISEKAGILVDTFFGFPKN